MPAFATLVAAAFNYLFSFYTQWMAADLAIKWARRTMIVALMVAFFTAIKACVGSLLQMVSTAGLPTGFTVGLGMFIPSNAGPVLSCLGSVWVACVVYRLKMDGLKW